ncbi:MAG: AN1-type zinc finger domain-containing protein, partial [Candidatus Hodarchaeota archaeon]
MTKKLCDHCGENSYMLFPCKNCNKSFCAVHRLPEKHDCISDFSSYTQSEEEGSYEAGSYDSQGYLTPANAVERPREYVWEPNVTELPQNPFDPKSGVVIKGI